MSTTNSDEGICPCHLHVCCRNFRLCGFTQKQLGACPCGGCGSPTQRDGGSEAVVKARVVLLHLSIGRGAERMAR
eukprot:scaffold184903_cov30-Tisochrysis_lutea.AAC.3